MLQTHKLNCESYSPTLQLHLIVSSHRSDSNGSINNVTLQPSSSCSTRGIYHHPIPQHPSGLDPLVPHPSLSSRHRTSILSQPILSHPALTDLPINFPSQATLYWIIIIESSHSTPLSPRRIFIHSGLRDCGSKGNSTDSSGPDRRAGEGPILENLRCPDDRQGECQ
jgi:hypothetical protein